MSFAWETISAAASFRSLAPWLTVASSSYIAFEYCGSTFYIHNEGGWSSPVLIKADRTNPVAVRIAPSNDVMIAHLDGTTARCLVLSWNGRAYVVGTEYTITTSVNEIGGLVLLPNGKVLVAYVSSAGAVETMTSSDGGVTWA